MLKLKFNGVFCLWLIIQCLTVQNSNGQKKMSMELLKTGIRLNMALERQIYHMDHHIFNMERSLMQILSETSYNSTKEDYITTSVAAMTMVRRLSEDWMAMAGKMRGLTSESLSCRLGNVRWPTGEDIEAATKAVTRGQVIYSLGTDLLAQGSTDNITFFTVITALDGFNIAKAHIKKHHYAEAAEWLQHSLSRISAGDTSVSHLSVLQHLVPALCYTGMTEECRHLMVYTLKKCPRISTPEDLFVQYSNISTQNTDALIDAANYLKNINEFGVRDTDKVIESHKKLCRGESKVDSRLRCRYVHHGQPHLRFQPFKMEELQWEPPVLRFYDALTDLESETLRKDALKRMQPSKVFDQNGRVISNDYRTSFIAWLYSPEHSELAHRLVPRMSDMTRLDADYADAHQVSSYALTGGYRPHMDYLENPFQYDRLATLMYYLTDVKQGGNTIFLQWGLSVPPVKNSAILWFNFRPDGEFQNDSHHSGCPVLQGRKWVLNKWIWNWGGLPCATNRTESFKDYYIE